MDHLSTLSSAVFRELSRFGDGDHSLIVRTDAQTFLELHRSGKQDFFTSHIAALMPNVVIKLQTPMSAQIVSALPPQQGCTVLQDPQTRLHVVDSLTDVVGLVKLHRAAILREDATLAAWSNDVQTALVSLLHVYKEVNAVFAQHDTVRAVDPSPYYGDGLLDASAADCFDQFIHNYDSATLDDKTHGLTSLDSLARNALPPLGTLDSVNSIDNFFSSSIRPNPFDTLSSASSTQSPMLGDSPTNFMTSGISRLHIHSTPQSPMATFSPESVALTFYSPAMSSGTSSDSMISTPLTIAPSVLSSPNSWNCTPLSDVGSLPVILETPVEGHFLVTPVEGSCSEQLSSQGMNDPALPDSPTVDVDPTSDHLVDSPSTRKRASSSAAPDAAVVQPESESLAKPSLEAKRTRRSRRSVSPKVTKAPEPRVRKTSPLPLRTASAVPTPSAPKRSLCPLPGRVVRSRRASPVPSASTGPHAARLTTRRVTTAASCDDGCEHEHAREYAESDAGSESEYEADRSEEDQDEDEDEDFRPAKRTRSSSVVSDRTIRPVRRKAVTTKVVASQSRSRKGRRTKSSWSSAKGKKKAIANPAACPRCHNIFTREGDMKRHLMSSCVENPNRKAVFVLCHLCDYPLSRHDAYLRHLGSDNCAKRQIEKAEREAMEAAMVEDPEAGMDELMTELAA